MCMHAHLFFKKNTCTCLYIPTDKSVGMCRYFHQKYMLVVSYVGICKYFHENYMHAHSVTYLHLDSLLMSSYVQVCHEYV